MELHDNLDAPLTRWLVRERLLPKPFVLVDVGVHGGIAGRWEALGDQLSVYGFDALEEVIAPLKAASRPDHHYFAMALGEKDGAQSLYVKSNQYEASFYSQARTQFDNHKVAWQEENVRQVPVRSLDSLFDEGLVPPADFIKFDCEGFEPEVLKGAERFLEASPLLGADLETNFNVSPVLTETHFWSTYQPLLHRRLMVFDAAFNRVPRASYSKHIEDLYPAGAEAPGRFRPGTWNILFARDLIQDCESPSSYPWMPNVLVDADVVLKSIIILELYGLLDWAYDYLVAFRDVLSPHVDVDAAIRHLVPEPPIQRRPRERGPLRRIVSAIHRTSVRLYEKTFI